jgi:hypothetical protein
MMSNLNNEYEKLLQYLDANLQPKTSAPSKRSNRSVAKRASKSKHNLKDSKKENLKKSSQKLIEDSQIHSYIPPSENPVFKQVNKSVGFDVRAFEQMMRQKLIEEYKKIQTYERPYISVTELTMCSRSVFYNRLKYKVDLKKKFNFAYLYLIQRIGNEIHTIVQGLYNFNESEKTIVSEIYQVKGRVDGIRESYLYELKSIDESKFKGKYVEEHYQQALIYAYILNTEYDYNIKKITIVYFMRNLKKVVSFDLPLDDSLAKSLLERAHVLKTSIEKSEVPDPVGANDEQCHWCLFRSYCETDKCKAVLQPWAKSKKVKTKTGVGKKKVSHDKEEKKQRESVFLL